MARTKRKAPAATSPTEKALARLDRDFEEWSFSPRAGASEYLWVVTMSLGGIALGVGVYAMFLRQTPEPLAFAPYVLALGAVLVGAYLLFGQRLGAGLRAGPLGVGIETEGKVSRHAWYEVKRVTLTHDVLRLETAGRPLNVALRTHPAAAKRILAEAQKRIGKRVDLDDEDQLRVGRPDSDEGELVTAEAPQITSMRCRSSDKALTVERDARMCGRCGALYHRTAIPRRCVECGKKLRS